MGRINLKASKVHSRFIVFIEWSNTGEITMWLLCRIIGSVINSPGPKKEGKKKCIVLVGIIGGRDSKKYIFLFSTSLS